MSKDDKPATRQAKTLSGNLLPELRSLMFPPVPDAVDDQQNPLRVLIETARNPLALWTGQHRTQDYVIQSGKSAPASVALAHPDLVRQVLENRCGHYGTFPGTLHCHDLVLSDSMAAYPSLVPSMSQFASQALGRYFATMETEASLMADRLAASPPDEAVALEPLISEVVGGMIQRTLLAQVPEAQSRTVLLALDKVLDTAGALDTLKYLGAGDWLPQLTSKMHDASQSRLRRTITTLVSARREQSDHRVLPTTPDLVSALLHAFRAAPDEASHDEPVTSITMAILSTCYATSQRTLVWALALLASAPAVQDRCAQEAAAVLANPAPLGNRLEEAVEIKALMKETLRLYPPVPVIRRIALADDANHGLTTAKGSTVLIAPWVLHRHHKNWQYPDAFLPERFLEQAVIQPYTFLPFGGGEQTCIGFGYMMLATRLVVLAMLGQLHIRLWDDQVLPIPVQRVGLVPQSPINLHVTRRTILPR